MDKFCIKVKAPTTNCTVDNLKPGHLYKFQGSYSSTSLKLYKFDLNSYLLNQGQHFSLFPPSFPFTVKGLEKCTQLSGDGSLRIKS